MPYPHHNVELLLWISVIAIVTGVLMRFLRLLPPNIALPLAFLPLVALAVVCVVYYRRTHGE